MPTARTSARLVLNQQALTETALAIAAGLLDFGQAIAEEAAARVPLSNDPRYGHIKTNWGVAIYNDGKKVGDISADGTATAKPRAFKPGKGLSGIVGFGFPARFHEMGTSDTHAEPFLAPASAQLSGQATEIIAAGAKPHWPKAGK